MSIGILLVDDHTMLRHGLDGSISKEEGLEILGQASDGLSALRKVRELSPDVVIMDITMPQMNGIEATREIKRDFPKVQIIALSMHSSKKFVTEMLRAGASGYLLKDCEVDELVIGIRTVMEGQTYLTPAVAEMVVDNFVRSPGMEESSVFGTLTSREREVLQLMSEGKTTKQIGLGLHISPKTVEAHRLRVMQKLDFDNVAQLTKYAIQEGLTSPEP